MGRSPPNQPAHQVRRYRGQHAGDEDERAVGQTPQRGADRPGAGADAIESADRAGQAAKLTTTAAYRPPAFTVMTFNHGVEGSSPSALTNKIK